MYYQVGGHYTLSEILVHARLRKTPVLQVTYHYLIFNHLNSRKKFATSILPILGHLGGLAIAGTLKRAHFRAISGCLR